MSDDHFSVELTKKPKNVTIIEGFPGFGLIGTITTEFLIEHLKCEKIGKLYFEDLPATVAIHKGEIIDPVSIYYNKEYNLVILHSITVAQGIEWLVADVIYNIAKQLQAKEIISLEGVGSSVPESERVFYYSTHNKNIKRLQSANLDPLDEGIIMGVTSSVLVKAHELPITAIFAETHSNLPDSKASASVITALDKYLKLKIDPAPLLDQAEQFEEKLKGILSKSKDTLDQAEKKKTSYIV